jgi:hypothetical protein
MCAFIILAVVVFIIYKIAKGTSPEAKVEKQIQQLKHQAYERKIIEKSTLVVEELGRGKYFEDSNIEIRILQSRDITIKSKSSNNMVFETSFHEAYSYSTGTHLEPRDEGGYDVVEDSVDYRDYHGIETYICGNWETHLGELYSRALSQKNSRDNLRKNLSEEDKRKRFGL